MLERFFGKHRPTLADGQDVLGLFAPVDRNLPFFPEPPLPQPPVVAPGGEVEARFPSYEQLQDWLAKVNRRRKQLLRAYKRLHPQAQRVSEQLIAQTVKSVRLHEENEGLRKRVTSLEAGAVKTAGDMWALRQRISKLMDQVFTLGVQAGKFEGQEDKLQLCRDELAKLVVQGYLLVECCYVCGSDQGLREFVFTSSMCIRVRRGGSEPLTMWGDGRSHPVCEVCAAKLATGTGG